MADVQRPWHMSRRRARRIGPVLLISLWLHLTLLLLLVVTVPYDRREEALPPPSTVAMVFEGGKPEGPALPNPQPNVAAPTEPPAPARPRHRLRRRRRSLSRRNRAAPQAAPTPAPVPTPPAPPPPPAATAEIPAPRPAAPRHGDTAAANANAGAANAGAAADAPTIDRTVPPTGISDADELLIQSAAAAGAAHPRGRTRGPRRTRWTSRSRRARAPPTTRHFRACPVRTSARTGATNSAPGCAVTPTIRSRRQ